MADGGGRASPPRGEWERLEPRLTRGELQLAGHLDDALPPDWELYLQPHINGCRPDIVLLHPQKGAAIYEVKDLADPARDLRRPWHTDENGRVYRQRDPFEQVGQYRAQLLSTTFAEAEHGAQARRLVSTAVVFTTLSTAQAREDFPEVGHERPDELLLGGADLADLPLQQVVPLTERPDDPLMNCQRCAVFARMRGCLREPSISSKLRLPLPLDKDQRKIVETRTTSGRRRVRGPAGSGKSMVLAARAAVLEAQGKDVLVVGYNITLGHYSRHFFLRHRHSLGVRGPVRVTWEHFHGWMRRTAAEIGRTRDYADVARTDADNGAGDAAPNFLRSALTEIRDHPNRDEFLRTYDAVLIDEGQDFPQLWLRCLSHVVRPGGEMLVVADMAQDLYAAGASWTDSEWQGLGFTGPWAELGPTYRLPPELIDCLEEMAAHFLRIQPAPRLLPPGGQYEISGLSAELTRCAPDELVSQAVGTVKALLHESELHPADVALLALHETGRECAKLLRQEGVPLTTIFGPEEDQKALKVGFHPDRGGLLAATPHSYKGWEARALVVVVDPPREAPSGDRVRVDAHPEWLYVALSRIRNDVRGTYLRIISANNVLNAFLKAHLPETQLHETPGAPLGVPAVPPSSRPPTG